MLPVNNANVRNVDDGVNRATNDNLDENITKTTAKNIKGHSEVVPQNGDRSELQIQDIQSERLTSTSEMPVKIEKKDVTPTAGLKIGETEPPLHGESPLNEVNTKKSESPHPATNSGSAKTSPMMEAQKISPAGSLRLTPDNGLEIDKTSIVDAADNSENEVDLEKDQKVDLEHVSKKVAQAARDLSPLKNYVTNSIKAIILQNNETANPNSMSPVNNKNELQKNNFENPEQGEKSKVAQNLTQEGTNPIIQTELGKTYLNAKSPYEKLQTLNQDVSTNKVLKMDSTSGDICSFFVQ